MCKQSSGFQHEPFVDQVADGFIQRPFADVVEVLGSYVHNSRILIRQF